MARLVKKWEGIRLNASLHFLFPLSIKMAVNPRDLYELREKLGQGFGVVSRV